MYQTLIDQPPGPVVRNPLALPLRLLLRLFNTLLAALSLATLALSLYLVLHAHGKAPSPDPPAAEEGLGTLQLHRLLHDWPLWILAGTGVLGLVTALTGLAGLQLEQRRSLSSHIALLSCLVVLHGVALVFLFVVNGWQKEVPEDPSGIWPALHKFMTKHEDGLKTGLMASMFVHLAAVLAASALHSIYQNAYEAWLDDNDGAAMRTQALLASTTRRMTAGGVGTPWARHLSTKYKIDSSQWACTEDAARLTAQLALSSSRLDEGTV